MWLSRTFFSPTLTISRQRISPRLSHLYLVHWPLCQHRRTLRFNKLCNFQKRITSTDHFTTLTVCSNRLTATSRWIWTITMMGTSTYKSYKNLTMIAVRSLSITKRWTLKQFTNHLSMSLEPRPWCPKWWTQTQPRPVRLTYMAKLKWIGFYTGLIRKQNPNATKLLRKLLELNKISMDRRKVRARATFKITTNNGWKGTLMNNPRQTVSN